MYFDLDKTKNLVDSTNYFVGETKHFVVRIISKVYGRTDKNFVDSTKSFSELNCVCLWPFILFLKKIN